MQKKRVIKLEHKLATMDVYVAFMQMDYISQSKDEFDLMTLGEES